MLTVHRTLAMAHGAGEIGEDSSGMTIRAIKATMRSRERETMIEVGIVPTVGAMTIFTRSGKANRGMIGVGGVVVGVEVTIYATSCDAGMVEAGTLPSGSAVAVLAHGGKSLRHMVRIGGGVVAVGMAAQAIHGQRGEGATNMACRAG